MRMPSHPAAYLGGHVAADSQALTEAAETRGWPAPAVYRDDGDPGQHSSALARLEAAITAGRHDALILVAPDDPASLMGLLLACTKHGVPVSFAPAVPDGAAGKSPAAAAASPASAASAGCGESSESAEVLTHARLEALADLFPGWRIWLDRSGWHARRRGDGYVQGYRSGAPAFHVRASSAADLAAQLCWQQAADEHAPDGCQASVLLPPPWARQASRLRQAI